MGDLADLALAISVDWEDWLATPAIEASVLAVKLSGILIIWELPPKPSDEAILEKKDLGVGVGVGVSVGVTPKDEAPVSGAEVSVIVTVIGLLQVGPEPVSE